MKIWGPEFNPRVKKVQVAASYAGIDLSVVEIDEAKRKEYLKKNPTGIIPTLETPEGPIYESNAILRHLARNSKGSKLYGGSEFEVALVDQWLDWGLTELEPAVLGLSAAYQGYAPYVKEIQAKAGEDVKKNLAVLEQHLSGKKFLVGNSLSIADISLASTLNFALRWILDETQRKSLKSVVEWYRGVTEDEKWRNVYGKSVLCKKALDAYTGALDE